MTADAAAGRPSLTITKDTTIKVSWGVLALVTGWVAYWSFQYGGERQADRAAVAALESRTLAQFAAVTADFNSRMAPLASDLNLAVQRVAAYSNVVDKHGDALQEMKLMRLRLDRSEHDGESQNRRMTQHEVTIEEVRRETIKHAVVLESILRLLNSPPMEPKKRNGVVPLRPFFEEMDRNAAQR